MVREAALGRWGWAYQGGRLANLARSRRVHEELIILLLLLSFFETRRGKVAGRCAALRAGLAYHV